MNLRGRVLRRTRHNTSDPGRASTVHRAATLPRGVAGRYQTTSRARLRAIASRVVGRLVLRRRLLRPRLEGVVESPLEDHEPLLADESAQLDLHPPVVRQHLPLQVEDFGLDLRRL